MLGAVLKFILGTHNERVLKKIYPIVEQINQLEPEIKVLSDQELQGKTPYLKNLLAEGKSLDDILPEALAVVREAGKRTLGMRHFDVQLIGGIALHKGNIAEMKTGEGKTLVATLAVYLNALTGKGVHLITVNDYLAKRDAEWMGPLYKFLGLSVAFLQNNMRNEERKKVYNCDIVYGTNSEFGFDYLRDNMVSHKDMKVQRGHFFAIVDEVDSILIDEARTPLIISGPSEDSTEKYYIADKVIPRLKPAVKGADGKWLPHSGDFQLEEKDKTVVLTEDGITTIEKYLGIGDLYKGKNIELVHCIHQSIKAHKLFKNDKDYIVDEGQVIIIDEHTGRKLEGRRYSDGLHQAIEAKERVTIQRENQTFATVTIQNYFKMYEKLAGMTGTAETESEEFLKIYNMDVLVIPPNKKIVRNDMPDQIYKDKKIKYNAILEEIRTYHTSGRPILVGTISVEISELISKMLQKAKINHNVLNAKNHALEAEIIAQAGQTGRLTIATNMAGRGTDIILGGNPNFQAEKYLENIVDKKWIKELPVQLYIRYVFSNDIVRALEAIKPYEELKELEREKTINYLQKSYSSWEEENKKVLSIGGLHMIGTERHEARRIDNQLRGRAGRQGDPGSSRFFLSLEDDLLRLFGSDRIVPWLKRMGFKDEEPIEHKWITSSIEKAQKKVEQRNFSMRKYLLEYDEVMNYQRKMIYELRDKVLFQENIKDEIVSILKKFINDEISFSSSGSKNLDKGEIQELNNRFIQIAGLDLKLNPSLNTKDEVFQAIFDGLSGFYQNKENQVTAKVLREIERLVLLEVIDSKWKRHLYVIDELQEGISLRAYGEKNPLVEYKLEASKLFKELLWSLNEEVLHILFTAQIKSRPASFEEEMAGKDLGNLQEGREFAQKNNSGQSVRKQKVGRNDPCPCGSGKKYKQCHGK
ncbi:MAG TPA: preprotein translocase subunit SecA [Spirochaetia bacterium]|nr:MAG: preprotein translocase subunit SecA [Spirochaetes bacterium GWB1_36_13]HCL57703.1 preprotein translocase subunit SecA [Spirochaetia bacterium]